MKLKISKLRKSYFYKLIRDMFCLYKVFKHYFNEVKIQNIWRDLNRHNFTSIVHTDNSFFPIDKVKVGRYTYGPLNVVSYGSDDESLEIGSFCSIASGVKFILGGEHKLNKLSTFPIRRLLFNKNYIETFSKGHIILKDDVWIGTDTLILSGVKLGQGTVVAAGSIVTKSFEPYSIIGGNPARLLRMRFKDETIQQLTNIDFDILTDEVIKDKLILLESEVDNFLYDKLITR